MACANLYFKHLSTDISVDTGYLAVGLVSTITVTLYNSSTFDGFGSVLLSWAGYSPTRQLDTPGTTCLMTGTGMLANPSSETLVPAGGSATFKFQWIPDGSVTPDPHNKSKLALFAQASAGIVSGECPGWSYPNDWTTTAAYNTYEVFTFIEAPSMLVPKTAPSTPKLPPSPSPTLQRRILLALRSLVAPFRSSAAGDFAGARLTLGRRSRT